MTTYNRAEVERLVDRARTRYAKFGVVATADALDMADQLEAARAEVDRLADCMRVAGLQCFMRHGAPEKVAEHLRIVAASWTEHEVKLATERDAARTEADQLRAKVDQLAAIVSISPADLRAAVDENARLQADNDRLYAAFDQSLKTLRGDKPTVHSVMCTWCGQNWPRLDGESYETARKYTNEHAERCPANYIRIERDQLRAQLAEATRQRDAHWREATEAVEQRDVYRERSQQLAARVTELEGELDRKPPG